MRSRPRVLCHLARAVRHASLADATMCDPDADVISQELARHLIDNAIAELVVARQHLPAPIEVAA